MPDRFVLDSPLHAAISDEPCLERGPHHLVSGRTVRRAALVGGLGAGAWLAMMALGQGHAQAAPAQPLPIGHHTVSAALGTVAKTATDLTAGLTKNPSSSVPAHVQHRVAVTTPGVAKVGARTHSVVHVATATIGRVGRVGRVGHTAGSVTTTVTHVTAPVTKPVARTVTSVLTTAKHVTAPITTPVTKVLTPVLTPIVAPIAPILNPVVGPILGVTAPITSPITRPITTPITTTVPTRITGVVGPIASFAPTGLITETAPTTGSVATLAVATAARGGLIGERVSSRSDAAVSTWKRAAATSPATRASATLASTSHASTSRASTVSGLGRGGLPSGPFPVPAPEGTLGGSAASGSAHSHDSGSALVGRSARLATPASVSTARPGSDRLPGDPIRSTDVSPD